MKFKKNPEFDFLEIADENLVVFDPDSGNTHIIEETAIDILKLIEEETELEDIILQLTKIYDVSDNKIREDVSAFIDSLVEKRIVLLV